MSIELEERNLKVSAEHGRARVFSLIVIYVVLAVAVGVARRELQQPQDTATHPAFVSQADGSASFGLR